MSVLNFADNVLLGPTPVDRVMMDGVIVWPPPHDTAKPLVALDPIMFFPVVLYPPPKPVPPPASPGVPLVDDTDSFFPVSLFDENGN